MRKSAESISERRERLAQQDAEEAALRKVAEACEDAELHWHEQLTVRDQVIGAALVNGMTPAKVQDITGLTTSWLRKIRRDYLAGLAITDDED